MGHPSDREKGPHVRERCVSSVKELTAAFDLAGCRFVLRRDAAHGVGDHAVHKAQRLGPQDIVLAPRETGLQQRRVEKMARKIAPERSAGPVRPLQPRR